MSDLEITIRQATLDDVESLNNFYSEIDKIAGEYFEQCFDKDCVILIARNEAEEKDIGFVLLNFEPKYSLYKKLEVPEIQDLNVLPAYRQQGIATQLVNHCEQIAKDQGCEMMGIAVGLTKEYGPAQRLYGKLGYIPDGYGVTFDRQGVITGQSYILADDLCLMLIKNL